MNHEQLRIERQIEWLKSASPDDWHRVALDFNWDERIEPLFWIVRQPECDRATALDVFWNGQPAGYLLRMLEKARMLEKGGADDEQDPVWAMLKYIAERIDSKGYTRSRIAYDATPGTRLDYDELVGYAKLLPRTPLHGHPDMLRSAHGREVLNDEDFYRRYPSEFHHSAMIDMPVPVKAWLDFPDMRSARIEAFSIAVNLFVVGFGAVFMTLFPFWKNIGLYTAAFAALSYCLYKGSADFRTLRGLLRVNRLELNSMWLAGALLLSVLLGAALASATGRSIIDFMHWFRSAHGTAALGAVALVVAVPVLAIVGWCLSKLLINQRAIDCA